MSVVIKPVTLFVTYEFGEHVFGGIGRCLNGLEKELRRIYEFDLILMKWDADENDFVIVECLFGHKPADRRINYMDYFEGDGSLTGYRFVHFFHVGPEILSVAKLLKKRHQDISIIYSCHSIFEHEKNIRNTPGTQLELEREFLTYVDKIHVLNKTSLEWLFGCYPHMRSKEITIIPNGIDVPDIDIFAENQTPNIVCLSRWVPGKGIEYLIDALPHVFSRVDNLTVTIVGREKSSWDEVANNYVDYLDGKIEALNYPVAVRGWLTKEEVYKLILGSGVCVVPSELEYFPYSILEPGVLGVPVACSRIEAICELFEDKSHFAGFMVRDSVDIADTLVSMFENYGRAMELGKSLRRVISNKYSWKKIAHLYRNLYL